MPKVRDSSETMGTMRRPSVLSRSSVLRMRTKLIAVENSRPSPLALSWASKADSSGTGNDGPWRRRAGR
ncbi:hypothetical protein D9M68_630710 [compost metagenome]